MINCSSKAIEEIVSQRFSYSGTDHPILKALYNAALLIEEEAVAASSCQETQENSPALCAREINALFLKPVDDSTLPKISAVDPIELVKHDHQLPPLPDVLIKLQRTIKGEMTEAEDIAKIIRSDTSLSTFLLRLVNSAFYSFPARVDNVTRAVTMVGVRPLYLLSMGLLFKDMVVSLPSNTIKSSNFWQHSIATAIAAQEIWRKTGGSEEDESIFTAGMLHDIGRLAMACIVPNAPDLYQHLRAKAPQKPLYEVERDLIGFDHAKFGGMLLKKWNLPSTLSLPTMWQYSPKIAAAYKEPAIIHLANIIAMSLGYNVVPYEVIPKLDETAVAKLQGIKDHLPEITQTIKTSLSEICGLFTH